MTTTSAFSTIQLNSSTTSSVRYSCVVFGMSHRSYGSHVTDTQLEEEETSVQNNDKEVAFDLSDDHIPSDDEEPKRVQGFFGVRPWSIKLSPSNPQPIEDSSPVSGTFSILPFSYPFMAFSSFLQGISTQKRRAPLNTSAKEVVRLFASAPTLSSHFSHSDSILHPTSGYFAPCSLLIPHFLLSNIPTNASCAAHTLIFFLIPSGAVQEIGNKLWLILFGWWVALLHALLGVFMCITVIGIPYGKFAFRLASYWLWPFGRYVIGPVRFSSLYYLPQTQLFASLLLLTLVIGLSTDTF